MINIELILGSDMKDNKKGNINDSELLLALFLTEDEPKN